MKKYLIVLLFGFVNVFGIGQYAKADFGDADFPVGMFKDGPKSYHDAWCRTIQNECRVRFQGPAMWVEGQGGIQRSQLVGYRYDEEGGGVWDNPDYYNYISYISKSGERREALFLFKHREAHRDFIRAFARWKRQEAVPIPNYRYPASQGPQETHGRDKGNNPYDNPPIIDFSIKTTKDKKGSKGNINCDSPVWKNKPRCKK